MTARSARISSATLVLLMGGGLPASAIPPPQQAGATPAPFPSARTLIPSPVLPQGSELVFLLEHDVNSALVQTGSTATMRLKAPLVLNGVSLADAGTSTTIRVLSAHRASTGEVDGDMQISVDPLPLKNGLALPLRLTHEVLKVHRSAGEESTQDLEDMAGTLLLPAYAFYRALRKGRDVVLEAGTPVHAFTAAALDARDPSLVVVASPVPLVVNSDPVHSEFSPAPFVTAPSPRPRPTRTPSPSPSPATPASVQAPSPAASSSQTPVQSPAQ